LAACRRATNAPRWRSLRPTRSRPSLLPLPRRSLPADR